MTTFGLELEIVPAPGYEVGFKTRITRALTEQAGVRTHATGYMGRAYSVWQVKDDSTVSIKRDRQTWYGCEVVSPVLEDRPESWEAVKKVCETLEANGAKVNVNCGMHVHVGVGDLNCNELKNIVKAYGTFGDEIDRVLPRSRRVNGNKARWCRRLWSGYNRQTILNRINNAEFIHQLENVLAAQNGRYNALSLGAYRRIGTIEFRQHSGTTDPEKAVMWAQWCVKFVSTFKAVDVTVTSQQTSTTEMVQVLQRVEGTGQRRIPARGGARRLALAFMSGETMNLARLREVRGKADSTDTYWINYLSRKCGFSFVRTLDGWKMASDIVESVTPADAFTQCFGLAGDMLRYFGRRRAALA